MTSKKPARKTAAARKSPATKSDLGNATATRNLTFVGTVKSESATGVGLFIDDKPLSLEQDGDTWTGEKAFDVGDTVVIKFRVKGLDTTDWSVQVDIDCPNGPVKVLSKKGAIGNPGGAGFDQTVKIEPEPCGQ